jgi:lysophospholipase L1-like esterase
VLLLELLLRIHNPFQARIKGDRIVLLTNKKYQIKNDVIPSLDPVVTMTRNSLGFRGPDPPSDFDRYLSIVAVGGSTTQCFFLSDDHTWPARVGQRLERSFDRLWMNNAGLDGHSTYGHLVLVEDHLRKVKPKVGLFLVGANDVARNPRVEFDAENVKGSLSFRSPTAFIKSLSPYSEVASLVANLYRSFNAYRHGLLHAKVELNKQGYADVTPAVEEAHVSRNAAPEFVQAYEQRLQKLINASRAAGIEPVLLTQPLLVGAGVDDVTGLDMARIRVGPERNGRMWWNVLESYNDVTRRVGRAQNVLVIDTAHELPKSSRYFSDFVHFSNQGANALADIVVAHLAPWLEARYPAYRKAGANQKTAR